MQLMDARHATSSMNLFYLQALLANLFFSFRDFVLSCKKLSFWNNLGSRMVSDRPILALKVDLFFQSFRLHWWWKYEESGFAENLTENFQFFVSWQNKNLWEKWCRYFVSRRSTEFSLTWWGKAPHSLESKSLYLCSTFQALFLQGKKITMISVFKNMIVSPIAASFLGFAVRSLPSPLRAFPLQTFVICNLVPLICNM